MWRPSRSPGPAPCRRLSKASSTSLLTIRPIKPARRETLLTAIAKARQWVDDMAQGRTATFAQIARREGKVERHVRLLAPLAFLSPRIVAAIIDGTAPANLTATCSPAHYPIPGPSRSGGSEVDQSARRQQAYTRLEKSRFARREQEGGNHRRNSHGRGRQAAERHHR